MSMTQSPSQGADIPVMALDRIVLMANQIGDFFAPYPPERRAEGIRNHLRTYWDPRMRAELLALIEAGGAGLAPHVIAGAKLLRDDSHAKPGYYGPPKA
ncbi:formate dehydrogenase subunit delta [Methylocystis rosea]|jgi:formate dehydrogenase subunit delta|uniref:formate dehydrogenase subunit delta n=1 Tax=Methylocystis rosea TaxID=173366 RepID=UPI0003789859|nr:formate dehydrogenase subunit delta [Methylocystis rosea]